MSSTPRREPVDAHETRSADARRFQPLVVAQHRQRDAGFPKRIAERRRLWQIGRLTIQHNARHARRISN
jgi:hypothetical protein